MDSDICRDMSTTNITFIVDLDVTRDDLIIKVRVINHWKEMSFYNKNEIWSIELILVDEQSYYITSPSFAALKPNTFRLTPQDQKLTFVQETVVKECTQFSGPKFGFSFVDFQSVLSMVHPQNLSLDVIGLVVVVGEMARESIDNSKHKIHIHIQNENGLEICLVLWGDYAYRMQEYIQDNPHNLQIIVILQLAQINTNSLSKLKSVWENTREYLSDGILYTQQQRLKSPDEQRNIFLDIMTTVKDNKGGVFIIYGYGGKGKTFLWKTISAAIRSEGEIVLNVASSGIASLLLTGGRTAHSRFIIPINLNEDSYYRINPDSDLANLVRKTSLIIWDEAPMVHKHAFEALDRTLMDILWRFNPTNSNTPFGGKWLFFEFFVFMATMQSP
uniref:ATP-dependent DNA helicase n=1 Tax=Lactuca sativa TaxID=4236 RepID=A0A9R1VZW2_LACSA|nr:hypothetical protein LSAT_V11C400223910 [Lactuca sativa]